MRKLFFIALIFFSCKSSIVTSEYSTMTNSENTSVEKDLESIVEILEKGDAPIVLYSNDIRLFEIKKIEINDFKTKTSQTLELKLIVQTNFDSIGILRSFSLFHKEEKLKKMIVSCNVQPSHQPTIEGYPPQYFYSIYNREEEEFEKIKLNVTINPTYIKDTKFLNLQVPPFIGEKGYIFSSENDFLGNTITYTTVETKDGYDVEKRMFSKVKYTEVFTFLDNELSSPIVKYVDNDTQETKYFYYGDNPLQVYKKKKYWDYDEGLMDSINIQTFKYKNIYYQDSLYNENRWLGYTTEDFSPYANQPKEAYYGVLNESEIVYNTFSTQNITVCKKNNFYINGQKGYDYLLKAYARKLAVKELENEHAKKNESVRKKEIQELPKKIIVQVSLTDFWFIQLTE